MLGISGKGEGMAQQIIEREWEIFKNKVMPTQASQAQIIDMRGAFYAGASVLLDELKKNADLPDALQIEIDTLKDETDFYFITNYGHLQKHDS